MTPRARSVLLRTLLMIAAIFACFALLQGPARQAEARASAALLQSIGFDRIGMAGPNTLYVVPTAKPSFLAVLTPSCSSLASVLAIGGLALLTPPCSRRRRAAAVGAAVGAIVVGNILRIAASLAIGLVAGRSSLVLFHDSVGNIFSFAYTLAGYMLLLYLLLPATGHAYGFGHSGAPQAPSGAVKDGDRAPVTV